MANSNYEELSQSDCSNPRYLRTYCTYLLLLFLQAEYWTAPPSEFPRLKSHGFDFKRIQIASKLQKIYWRPKNWKLMVHCGRFWLTTIPWNFVPIQVRTIVQRFTKLPMCAELQARVELYWVDRWMWNQVGKHILGRIHLASINGRVICNGFNGQIIR